MKALIFVLLSFLAGCASNAQTPPASAASPVTNYTNTVVINKPGAVGDGYEGGLHVERDTSTAVGGTRGWVASPHYAHTIAGAGVTQFEWVTLSVLDNHATAGENVANYAQGNRFGTGPTWAAVSEVADTTTNLGGVISHEFDMWVTGGDTGGRIGLDVVLGDVKLMRGMSPPSTVIEGSAGIRIGNSNNAYLPRWTRGIQLTGNYVVGIDMSGSNNQTALRLKQGQSIALDEYDSVKLQLTGGRVSIKNGAKTIFEIDMTTGDIYKNGVKVL